MIHHFRDEAMKNSNPVLEKITIFDEAQRAWNQEFLTTFMKRKKGILDFSKSEPEFLIEIMDRHQDWAVIVCLVGGGQEIKQGENGIMEWFRAIRKSFPAWKIHVSDRITDSEYVQNDTLNEILKGLNYQFTPELHLGVSLRSFRSEKVAHFVKALLDADFEKARNLYQVFRMDYPIFLTRDLQKAKNWLRTHAHGSERYGVIAHSKAKRLKPLGIWVDELVNAPKWFLNPEGDVRSSFALECTATELVIQGLELDWAIVAWDANMRLENGQWKYYEFSGAKWLQKHKDTELIKNAYRVLLTRARQGMVLFVPEGDADDLTRKPEWYDGIFRVLKYILE